MLDDQALIGILAGESYISADDAQKAVDYAKEHRSSVKDYLFSQKVLSTKTLGQAIAEYYGVTFADFENTAPVKDLVLKIPGEVATKYRAILFSENEKGVVVATDNPKQAGLPEKLKEIFKEKPVTLAYALDWFIDENLIHYKKTLETRFSKITAAHTKVAPEMIDEIFNDAITFHASDIHFEPQENEVIIRFRIDGVLHEAGKIPVQFYDNILNRVKVMANLRIDEHAVAQDGALRYKYKEEWLDMRISIAPVTGGEKIAIRLLGHYIQGFTLADIGLSESDQKIIEQVAKKPFGMILVTGPTGSGKTTTLYSLLRMLNRAEVNITTIEDPVEYHIKGINQIQVNTAAELTFANGLRSIVRQDPNIILVGEIRDLETAEISVNAALTGHLLLSTFHANDAATAIPRLLDMGVEPFLLASTLEVVIAQRLIRKICEKCRHSIEKSKERLKKEMPEAVPFFDIKGKEITLYEGKGCTTCNNTGFKGRTAIYEIISLDPEIKALILNNPSSAQIWKLARKNGGRSLFEDGLEKVENGITTLAELLRVANPPEG